MRCDRFRSKGLAYFLIGAFLLLIMAESVPASASGSTEENKGPVVRIRANKHVSAAQQERFETLMAEGKRLYDDMENDSALQKFLQARAMAVTQRQKSDVYFYLSLVYYGLLEEGRSNEFTNAVNMLIEVDYYRQLDPQVCPQRYLEMYQEIKKNYGVLKVRSNPAGADVYLNDSDRSAGTTPLTIAALAGKISLEVKKGKKKAKDTIEVVASEETQSPEYELKGKSSTLYIVGGVLLAAGIGAAVALGGGGSEPSPAPIPGPVTPTTGSIQVSSNPAGAAIYLNGIETDQVTPSTLPNLSPGSYIVLLIKEGYLYFEELFTVTAGQTTVVNSELQRNIVNIVVPDAGTTWMVGSTVEIVWEVGEPGITAGSLSGMSMNSISPSGNVYAPVFPGERTQTNITMPRQADRGRDLRASTVSSGSRVASRTISRRATSPAGRLPTLSSSRKPFLSQGMDFQKMNALAPSGVQVISAVKIDLYKAGALNREITASTKNTGRFEWKVPRALEEGQNYKIRVSVAADANIFFESPKFSILKNAPNIVTDKDDVGVFEDHNTTFQVKLSQQPSSQVEITVKRVSGDQDVKISSGGTLTFTKTNWNTYKKVTLYAAPDGDTINGKAVIRLSAAGIPSKDIDVTEVDLTEGPPKLLSPADGSIFGHYPRTTTLKWEALPGVSGYRVEVQYQSGVSWYTWRDVTVTGTSYTFNFVGSQLGRWRVTAISGGGIQGPPSGWWGFRYTI
ncbi:MAG: PEGA domain-containing protein [Candidatus Aminicenantaceae bacterium]